MPVQFGKLEARRGHPYRPRVRALDVIQWSADFLTARGVERPRLQVEPMLSQILDLPRLHRYLNFNRELRGNRVVMLREMVRRRVVD